MSLMAIKMHLIVFISTLSLYSLHAMEKSLVPPLPPRIDEKCLNVARYLLLTKDKINDDEKQRREEFLSREHKEIKQVKIYMDAISFVRTIPSLQMRAVYPAINDLDEEVFKTIMVLTQSPIVLATIQRDVFTLIVKNFLPNSFEDKAGFFDSSFENKVIEETPSKNFSKQQMIDALSAMSVEQALYMLNYITKPQGEILESHFDYQMGDSCKGGSPLYTEPLHYYWSFQDHKDFTDTQRNLLDDTVKYSNIADSKFGDKRINKRFLIGDEHIEKMKIQKGQRALKDFIKQNEKYRSAKIRTDIKEPTFIQRMCDRGLYYIPHVAAMVIPDILYAHTNGMRQGAMGIIGCVAGSSGFGHYLYPIIDSYNSNIRKQSEWFGKDNYTRNRRSVDFAFIAFIHYVATIVAQKLFTLQVMPLKLLGVLIYGIRFFLAMEQLYTMEKQKNENPFNRGNKDGLPYTLEDLVNGPKFNDSIN